MLAFYCLFQAWQIGDGKEELRGSPHPGQVGGLLKEGKTANTPSPLKTNRIMYVFAWAVNSTYYDASTTSTIIAQ